MSHPSDNLYSANDEDDDNSDRQSLSDELSPSDGYFNRGSGMSSNTLVADPSIDRKERVEDKTLIPPPNAQQRAGGSSRTSNHPLLSRSPPSQSYASQHSTPRSPPPRPSSYTPASSLPPRQSEDMYSENSALLNGPPPAYTPSPVSPTSTGDPVERSYSTFPEHRLESGIPPTREPESMGTPAYQPTETTPLASAVKLTPTKKRWLKHFGIAVLVLAIFTMFTSASFHYDKNADKLPTVPGKGDDQPDNDDSGTERPPDSTSPYCTAARYKEDIVTYEFPVGSDLTVIQTTRDLETSDDQTSVSTTGEIRLRRLPKDSKHGNRAYFTVDVQVSDQSLEVEKTWDEVNRVLKIVTPKSARLSSRDRHCVSVEITAWIPENAQFSGLLFEAISLTLRVLDDVKLHVSGRSKFTTISGGVRFPAIPASDTSISRDDTAGWRSSDGFPFSSRKIFVETISGSIIGNYPLMDFLGLSSQSGSIKTDVFPQPVLPSAPAPADLEVQTSSGSINVNCPVDGRTDIKYTPPPRNYITSVHSTSASISGSYYLGASSIFKSTSGSVRITGLPVLRGGDSPSAPKNNFETHTVSGSTTVEVLDPIFISLLSESLENQEPVGDDEPFLIIPPNNFGAQALFEIDSRTAETTKLHSLISAHSSNTAAVRLQYPSVWEGVVHGKSVSGKITATGDGIIIRKDKRGPGFSDFIATKGDVEEGHQGSNVEMKGISGSLTFVVGLRGGAS